MSNGKLRLNLNALRLKSFETTTPSAGVRGTVQGMESDCGACTGCTETCGPTWCGGCTFFTVCPWSSGGTSTTDGGGC